VRVLNNLKWGEWGPRFNHYLTTMESLLWPDLIVLGGGISRELHKFAPLITTKAPVIAADFLNQAGIVGAALFAEEQLRLTA
jgi:polyphosphate glucokinase